MSSKIYNSAYYSLIIQLIISVTTLVASGYLLSNESLIENELLKSILTLEMIVQTVEFLFYVWLLSSFPWTYEVTKIRYLDWFITTPAMLMVVILFLRYNENKSKNKNDDKFREIINKNKKPLAIIFISNFLMLIFGLLGETKHLSRPTSFTLGMISFFVCFGTLYKTFIGTQKLSKYLFYVTFVLWSLYGAASLAPYVAKNISYNILDLFSKNINGLFIIGYILFGVDFNLNYSVINI